MIHVVLDTTIFRKAPKLDTREFRILSQLLSADRIVLHVPYVVEREFVTFLEQEQRRKIEQAIGLIARALKYESLGPKSRKLHVLLEQLRTDQSKLVEERAAAFVGWLKKNNAIRQVLAAAQSRAALEAYFQGNPPVRQPKFRKDLPDSFIFQQILGLTAIHGPDVVVVVEDGGLRSACENASIKCHGTLLEFIRDPQIQEFYADHVITKYEDQICAHVLDVANAAREDVTESVEELLLSEEHNVLTGSHLPGDLDQVFLTDVDAVRSLDIDDVEYVGSMVFIASVRVRAELGYEFPVSREEALSEGWDVHEIFLPGDRYVDAMATDCFEFNGRLELEFEKPECELTTLDAMKDALRDPSLTVGGLQDFRVLEKSEL